MHKLRRPQPVQSEESGYSDSAEAATGMELETVSARPTTTDTDRLSKVLLASSQQNIVARDR